MCKTSSRSVVDIEAESSTSASALNAPTVMTKRKPLQPPGISFPDNMISSTITDIGDENKVMTKVWAIVGGVQVELLAVVMVWYFVGVASICSTKILADRGVPPLVLTFQQLFLGSILLRLYLGIKRDVQPIPKAVRNKIDRIFFFRRRIRDSSKQSISDFGTIDQDEREEERLEIHFPPSKPSKPSSMVPSDDTLFIHFGLMGVFDGLDFLCTAIGFTMANASFVETVKSSQPITTTILALFFGIDTLQRSEALAMAVIIAGVFCSTMGNAEDVDGNNDDSDSDTNMNMTQSIQTTLIGVTANLMFAFRANAQKKFRAHPDGGKMNDANMLMWMQRMGSLALTIPIMIWELPGMMQRTRETPFWDELVPFWALVFVNAVCFSFYTLTNTFVLSKVSVGQHTGLNALRRMFVIIFTAIAFGVPITPMKALGIALCFSGFSVFSFYRNQSAVSKTEVSEEKYAAEDEHGAGDDELDVTSMAEPLLNEPEAVATAIKTSSSKNPLTNYIPRPLLPLFQPMNIAHEHGT